MTSLTDCRPVAYELPGPGVRFRARLEWSRLGWAVKPGRALLTKEGRWEFSPVVPDGGDMNQFGAYWQRTHWRTSEEALGAWDRVKDTLLETAR